MSNTWSPQQIVTANPNLIDRHTSAAPALAVYQNRLYLAWKNASDGNLYWSTYDDNRQVWSNPQLTRDDRNTATAPALAVYHDRLYLVWKGADDQNMWWSYYDGSNFDHWSWSPQMVVAQDIRKPDRGTSTTPALAPHAYQYTQPFLFMAWKAVWNETDIYWSKYDGYNAYQWDGQRLASSEPHVSDRGTSTGPALLSFMGRLYMVWKGIDPDEALYWSFYDGQTYFWSPQVIVAVDPTVADRGTSAAPALVDLSPKGYAFGGRDLQLFWKGKGTDPRIWQASFDTAHASWSSQALVVDENGKAFETSTTPALAFRKIESTVWELSMVWKGPDPDQRLHWSSWRYVNIN